GPSKYGRDFHTVCRSGWQPLFKILWRCSETLRSDARSSSAIAQNFLKLRHVLLQLISKLSGQNIVVPLIILLSINSLIWYLKSGISSWFKTILMPLGHYSIMGWGRIQ